jgi:predicted Zn-dependent protease
MTTMAAQQSKEILQKEKISRDPQMNGSVTEVGRRIAAAASQPDYQWEFHVIDNPKTANAFCLPGGKVFVYTGLFRYIQDEPQLAAVIGHEVAHALARHGAERVSMVLLAQTGGAVLGAASGMDAQVFQQAFGVAANYGVVLPFSRSQESEADRIGLILMAKAGYPPQAALAFWDNMARGEKGQQQPPAFLSTHPATADRIAAIERDIPEAMRYYRR